jgi:hypothetical protein
MDEIGQDSICDAEQKGSTRIGRGYMHGYTPMSGDGLAPTISKMFAMKISFPYPIGMQRDLWLV